MNNPTTKTYSLTNAYEFFNRELFFAALPACLITMQRHQGAFGFFSGERFANASDPKEITDEIALNPVHFATRKPDEVLSTLVHEMVHLWQHHFGEQPRKGYTTDNGLARCGRSGSFRLQRVRWEETGQKVTHLVEENGRYARAVAKLLKEHPAILYHDRSREDDVVRKKKAASKTKYTCPGCGLNAWAKPPASLVCGACQEPMQAENSMS